MRLGAMACRLSWLLAALLLLLRPVPRLFSQDTPIAKRESKLDKIDSPAPAKKKSAQPKKEVAPSAPPEAWLKYDAWKDVLTTPLETGEIDRLLASEFQASHVVPAPLATDEQFLRRVRLDLTGQLPTVAEIEEFLADNDENKRAKQIDRLLDTDDYARHWARYWRETVNSVDAPFGKAHVPIFEEWLFQQFKQNRNWGEIVRALLTAEGALKKDDPDNVKNGALFFLGRFNAIDGDISRTAETSRLFLGIQIQCAQCHDDRRTNFWHQVQFHELAGFFARMSVGGSTGQLIKINVKPGGEHLMPSDVPDKQFVTFPRFLDGQATAKDANDAQRRQSLADCITSPENYWFSATFTNRICSELFGQPFFERVDDLSPASKVVFPTVINRLAAAFKGSQYDIKGLLRAIANSQAYQREVRLGESLNSHLHFAAVYPVRLRADVLWESLSRVLTKMPVNEKQGLEPFMAEFTFDPSLKADEVVGSIGQALWLLNSQVVNDRIKVADIRLPPPAKKDAKGAATAIDPEPTLLKLFFAKYGEDDAAVIRGLYLHVLARKPTDKELQINLQYVKETQQSASRNEALEDIFKVLLNSTEFQHRR